MSDPGTNLPAVRHDLERSGGSQLSPEDLAALERAVRALEHSSMASKIADVLGRQLGTFGRLLPSGVTKVIDSAAERAILLALDMALRSLEEGTPLEKRLRRINTRFAHKAAAVITGAAGGAFGFTSLPVELPLSTMIILRSIADIAREEGEDMSDRAVAIACLEVFALGAKAKDNELGDAAFTEGGYFAVRAVLARAVSEAARVASAQGLADQGAPVLLRFVSQVGARFGLVVSEKLAAQAIPIIGAAGGAAINYAFVHHFQSLAHAHFTVRRLERRYGADSVRAEYDRLLRTEKVAA